MKRLTPLLFIIGAFVIAYLYTWPQWQATSGLKMKNQELKDAQQKAQQLKEIRDSLIAQYEAIPPSDLEKVSKVVPTQYNPIKLTADINAIALRHSMLVKDFSFVDKKETSEMTTGIIDPTVEVVVPESPYKVVEFDFATEGQYKDLVVFLADLEKNLQLLDIKKVTVDSAASTDKPTSSRLTFKITLDSYWMN